MVKECPRQSLSHLDVWQNLFPVEIVEIWKNQDFAEQLSSFCNPLHKCELLVIAHLGSSFNLINNFFWLMSVICRMKVHYSSGLFHPLKQHSSSVLKESHFSTNGMSSFCISCCPVTLTCTWSLSEVNRVKIPAWLCLYSILSDIKWSISCRHVS